MSLAIRFRSVLMTLLSLVSLSLGASELTILSPDLPSQSEPGGVGRDSEIVATVLEQCGYQPQFQVLPFGRHLRSFSDLPTVDAVTTVSDDQSLPGYASLAYVWYQNGASMLESSESKPYSVGQLRGLRVVAFANAAEILGIEHLIGTFSEYQELANQRLHSSMLYFRRVDVVLSDGLIFSEINKRLAEDPKFASRFDMREPILFTPLFDPEPYHMVFRDKNVRDNFDRCFRKLEGQGVIRSINVKYVDKYRDVVGYGYLGY